eukprot:GILK01012910.1.p1 GENE.GILK01012910.1~~GILK01012910.1.p1  ORF type:complete len:148 (+),score=21.27 GILK01012910.1:131-574(+)
MDRGDLQKIREKELTSFRQPSDFHVEGGHRNEAAGYGMTQLDSNGHFVRPDLQAEENYDANRGLQTHENADFDHEHEANMSEMDKEIARRIQKTTGVDVSRYRIANGRSAGAFPRTNKWGYDMDEIERDPYGRQQNIGSRQFDANRP